MTDYDNTDSGALFRNDKRGNEKAPDYTGDIYDASGKKRRIAAWIKTSQGGKTYMQLKVEDVWQNNQPAKDYPESKPQDGDFDDIPF